MPTAEEPLPTPDVRLEVSRTRAVRWLAVAAYVAIIFVLSAQPGLSVPGTFELRDKFAHVAEYGGLSWLVERAARVTWPGAPAMRRALVAVLAISALGVLDEWFQSGVPGRDSTVYDWIADTAGAGLGQAWALWRARRGEVA